MLSELCFRSLHVRRGCGNKCFWQDRLHEPHVSAADPLAGRTGNGVAGRMEASTSTTLERHGDAHTEICHGSRKAAAARKELQDGRPWGQTPHCGGTGGISAGEDWAYAFSKEHLAAPKQAAIGQPRVVICHVAAALDISAKPSHPAAKLQGCAATTQGVEAVVSRTPCVGAHDLGHVVPEAEDEAMTVWGRTASVCPPGGPIETVDSHPSLQDVDWSRVLPCADRESPP